MNPAPPVMRTVRAPFPFIRYPLLEVCVLRSMATRGRSCCQPIRGQFSNHRFSLVFRLLFCKPFSQFFESFFMRNARLVSEQIARLSHIGVAMPDVASPVLL